MDSEGCQWLLVQDVTAKKDGRLIARAFVSPPTLASLQGSIAAALVSPDIEQVGVFKAGFLVVTSLEHPYNNLGDLQRAKWSPTAASLLGTLDIGCAACLLAPCMPTPQAQIER